ncbi:hypothetical protein [Labrys neptuniae]|uniref:DUF1036 domain-containing protein n=1 Tax=Labrys neptuniae TaxID=376174 RepID=A0ABV3PXU2_9HYPH
MTEISQSGPGAVNAIIKTCFVGRILQVCANMSGIFASVKVELRATRITSPPVCSFGVSKVMNIGLFLVLVSVFISMTTGVMASTESQKEKKILTAICGTGRIEKERCHSSSIIEQYRTCDISVVDVYSKKFGNKLYYISNVISKECTVPGGKEVGGVVFLSWSPNGSLKFAGYADGVDYNPKECAIIRPGKSDALIYCLIWDSKFGITNQFLYEISIKDPSTSDTIDFKNEKGTVARDLTGFFDSGNQDAVSCDDKTTGDRIYFRFDNLRMGNTPDLLELDAEYVTSLDARALCTGDFPHPLSFGEPDTGYALIPPEKLHKDTLVYDSRSGVVALQHAP